MSILKAGVAIIILGLLILVAAAVVIAAGLFSNTGSSHALHGVFSVLGYHVTGSTGTLFLFGTVVGAAGMLGLALLLTGARHTSRRGLEARRALKHSQRETAAAHEDRDALIEQRDSARAATAETETAGQEREDLATAQPDLSTPQPDAVITRSRRVRVIRRAQVPDVAPKTAEELETSEQGAEGSADGDPVPASATAAGSRVSHRFGRRAVQR